MGKTLSASFYPGALKVKKVSFGIASDNPDVDIDVSTGFATASNILFTVTPGTIVTNLMIRKRTAFGSTGAFTMDFGDTDPDGYIESTDAVMSDVGLVSMAGLHTGSTGAAVTVAYKSGRVYTSDDSLNILATVGTAKINAGLADAFLFYFDQGEV